MYPAPPLCALMDPSYYHSGILCLLDIPVKSEAFYPGMGKGGLGMSEEIVRYVDISVLLTE